MHINLKKIKKFNCFLLVQSLRLPFGQPPPFTQGRLWPGAELYFFDKLKNDLASSKVVLILLGSGGVMAINPPTHLFPVLLILVEIDAHRWAVFIRAVSP